MSENNNPWSKDFEAGAKPKPAVSSDPHKGERARKAYGRAVALVREVFRTPEEMDRAMLEAMARVADDLIKELLEDNQDLLALTVRSTGGNYLPGHAVNVTIYSIRMAIALGWGREKLLRLALAGLMHDIGMTPWLKLASGGKTLSPSEYQDLQLHVTESARLLDRSAGDEDGTWRTVVDIILHERDRKTRGPRKPRFHTVSDEVRVASGILGVADTYEALTHPRSFRRSVIPHAGLKYLLRLEDPTLDREAVRLLAGRMTLFPPGSFVRLSTGEVGVVCQVFANRPMRPEVLVLLDRKGETLRLPHTVDLNGKDLEHVEAAIDETELQLEDRRLMAALQAARWWVE